MSDKVSEKSPYFQEKVWYIMNSIQANQLFVHSSNLDILVPQTRTNKKGKTKSTKSNQKSKKLITKRLPEILTICILNALSPNSAMLLVGGHGGGKTSIVKYLGRMFTGMSLAEAEECILRGHPQLTEEKIIATLNIKKLMKEGEEEVIWRRFSSNFWKIIDEVNRCSPYTQNILLSLLAEGKIKYYDSVLNISKYCVYATLNPNDVGTFEMAAPFLDRFGISVPISMPKSQDLAIILSSHDEKLGGYDELIQVPQVLTVEQLLNIWYEVENITCSQEALDFIHAIIREFTLCERIDKGNSDYLKPSTGLCAGCHYNIPNKIPCCNSDSILSVRVAKDLLRYSKALSWLLNQPEISINTIITLAPYVISHRVTYIERLINTSPYWGNKYKYTQKMLEIIQKRFLVRKKAYQIIQNLQAGTSSDEEMNTIKMMAKSDLIIIQDLLPLAQSLFTKPYQEKVQIMEKAHQLKDINTISQIRSELLRDIDFPNRGALISRLNGILRELTLRNYNCSMELWNSIRFTIDGLLPDFSQKLRETTKQRGTYRLKNEDLELEINVTGIQKTDIVNFSFFGGETATILKERIQENHKNSFKKMEELIEEAENSQKDLENKYIAENPSKISEPPSKSESTDDLFDEEFFQL
ncbi:hypothetical protein WKT22_01398 [Candidatus Lokiarchaeum ossiferum]